MAPFFPSLLSISYIYYPYSMLTLDHISYTTRAQDPWGWLSTTGERGPVSENAWEVQEGFRIVTGGDRVRTPDSCGTNGDLHDTACAMECQTNSGTQSSHPEADGAAEIRKWRWASSTHRVPHTQIGGLPCQRRTAHCALFKTCNRSTR